MTDAEKTTLAAIEEISRFKALINRVPSYALLLEVKARTKDVRGLDVDAAVASLAATGEIRTGATLNDLWCSLPDPLKHTDIMNGFEKAIKAFLDKKAAGDATLFKPDPMEADIPGTIEVPQGASEPMLRFTPALPAVRNELKRLHSQRVTSVRIIIRVEE